MATRSLVIRFVADTAQASRNIDNLIAKTNKAQGMGMGGMGSMGGGMGYGGGMYSMINRLYNSFVTRLIPIFQKVGETGAAAFSRISKGIGITALAVIGLGYTLNRAFHYGNLVENAMIQLKILTGSEDKAHYFMDKAIEYSRKTRFKPAETFAATASAVQFGIDPFREGAYGLPKGAKFMDIVSSVASLNAMRGNPIGLGRALYGLLSGDVRVLRPVRALVDPAWQAAKKVAPVGTKAFREKFIEGMGKVPALIKLGKEFENSMVGMFSTIIGYAEEFWIKFSGANEKRGVLTFWSQMKSIVMDIRDEGEKIMKYLGPGLVEAGAALGSAFKFVWDMIKAIWKIVGPFLLPAFQIIWQIVRAIGSTFIFVLQTVTKISDAFADVFSIKTGLGELVAYFTELVTGIQMLFQFASIFIDWVLRKMDIRKALGPSLSKMFGMDEEPWDPKKGSLYIKKGSVLENIYDENLEKLLLGTPDRSGIRPPLSIGGVIDRINKIGHKTDTIIYNYIFQGNVQWRDVQPVYQATPGGPPKENK